MRLRKGIAYYATYAEAREIARTLGRGRIIAYEVGWAIQYYVSGPYYPELECDHAVDNPNCEHYS